MKKVYMVTISAVIPVVAESPAEAKGVATERETLLGEAHNFKATPVAYIGGELPEGITDDTFPWGSNTDRTIEEWLGGPRQYSVAVPIGLADEFEEMAARLGVRVNKEKKGS